MPGTPAVVLQGKPVFGTTVQGPGAGEPSGYRMSLAGNAALRSLVVRIDLIALAAVSAPAVPGGREMLC